MNIENTPNIKNNTYENVDEKLICLFGYVEKSMTLRRLELDYALTEGLTVRNNATLTIEPGTFIRISDECKNDTTPLSKMLR